MWLWLIAHSMDIIVILASTVVMLILFAFSDNIFKALDKLGDKLNNKKTN